MQCHRRSDYSPIPGLKGRHCLNFRKIGSRSRPVACAGGGAGKRYPGTLGVLVNNSGVRRRSFVRLLALGGVGALLAACQQPAAAPTAAPAAKPTEAPKPVAAAKPTEAAKPAAGASAAIAKPAAQAAPAQSVGIGQIPAALVEAAKKEGALTFYGAAGQDVYDKIFADFQKDYPDIKVSATRVATSGLKERVLTEVRSGKVNVDLVHASSEHADFVSAGAIDPTVVPWAKDVSISPAPEKLGIVAESLLSKHVIYNSSMLKKEETPKSWQDLTDPKWKGKLALELGAYEWFYALRETMKQSQGEEKTRQFFTDLAKNIVLREGSTQILEFMAAGEFPINLESYGHRYVAFKRDGAPFELVMPQLEPVAVIPSYWGAIKGSPRPNAAKLAQHWILTDNGQAAELKADRIPIVRSAQGTAYAPLFENVKTFPMHAGDLDYETVAKEFNSYFKK